MYTIAIVANGLGPQSMQPLEMFSLTCTGEAMGRHFAGFRVCVTRMQGV
jgi:hypothetical protein